MDGLRERLEGWAREAITRLPPWTTKALAIALVAVPLVALAGYGLVQGALLGPGQPLEPIPQDRLYTDGDGDGLPDLLENYVYGTDPNQTRSSAQVVPDGYLARYGYDPSDPSAEEQWAAYPGPEQTPDAFGPGALPPEHRVTVREVYLHDRPANWDENETGPWDNGLDPTKWRSPSGLPVPWLLSHDLDPLDPDVGGAVLSPETEGDGLSVQRSYETATDPRVADTDGDGLADHVELDRTGTDPATFDTAGSGIADGWALHFGLDPTDQAMAHTDPDRDGLTNAQEFNASLALLPMEDVLAGQGLDPTRRSSGGAPIPDGWLVSEGLDPFEAGVADKVLHCASDDARAPADDLEDLCLTVLDAYRFGRPQAWSEAQRGPWMGGLSARTNDTDGDGLIDALELRGWTINLTTNPTLDAEAEPTRVSSDPLSTDTDHDGLSDAQELVGRLEQGDRALSFPRTDPGNGDTDFDGLSDGREVLVVSRELAKRFGDAATLDPVSRDSDKDGLEDGLEWDRLRARASACRDGGATYGFTNPQGNVRAVMAAIAAETGAPMDDGEAGACVLLEPWGDPDNDGTPNILDDDSDGEGLLDGWEVLPPLYDQSPFASEHPRTRTDPVNPDSDGDGLPDQWEVKYGAWDRDLQRWNLDPGRWSSFGDDVSDADRDLDDDGITWYTFHRAVQGFDRRAHSFEVTNWVEYLNGTDPNRASTTGTDLLDGWTIFWGRVYPSLGRSQVGDLYPGAPGPFFLPPEAPVPAPLSAEDGVLGEATIHRFATSERVQEGETLINVFDGVQAAEGGTVYQFERLLEHTFLTAQEHGTNPYLEDTDGDAAPDAYEIGQRGSDGYPDPVRYEGGDDQDQDGAPMEVEARRGTDPNTADTDLGGAPDGDEIDAGREPLDPTDDASVNDPDADLDCDGLTDAEETAGWEHPQLGTVKTPPLLPDGDRDGLLDGFDRELAPGDDCTEPLRGQGVLTRTSPDGDVVFLGEASRQSDPDQWSTAGDGVSDGYRAVHGLLATETRPGLAQAYEATRPAWWSEPSMGPWLWGPAPAPGSDVDGDGTPDTELDQGSLVLVDVDLDNDGLHDANGEDPTPGAGPDLVPPGGRPDAQGLTAAEARLRGGTFGPAQGDRDAFAAPDADGDGVTDPADRLPVEVRELSIDAGNPPHLDTARTYPAQGRVVALPGGGAPARPVANATVVLELNDHAHPIAVAFTGPDGRFQTNLSFARQQTVQVPPDLVAMGVTGGLASWELDTGDVPLGQGPEDRPNGVRAWVLNTTGAALPGSPTYLGLRGQVTLATGQTQEAVANGLRGTTSEPVPVTLTSQPTLALLAPSTAAPGETIAVRAELLDGGGSPLPDWAVTLAALGTEVELTTRQDGTALHNLTLPGPDPGTYELVATFPGATHIEPATARTTVATKHPTRIELTTLSPVPAFEGTNLTLGGRLAGVPGDASSLILNLTGPNGQRSLPVDAQGGFHTRVELPPGLVGNVTLTLTFDGTTDLLAAQAQAQVPVHGEAALTLTLPEGALAPGDRVDLKARLTDADGTPLPNRVVRFQGLPGAPIPPVLTDTDGTATANWTAPSTPGTWSLLARFPGDDQHAPAQRQAFLTASTPTRLVLDHPGALTRGSLARATGALTTDGGEPLPGQAIDLQVAGEPVGVAVTDDRGRFSLTWPLDPETPLGKATLSARFNGSTDHRYRPSTTTQSFPVQQGLTLEPLTLELRRTTNPVSVRVALDDGRALPPGTLTLTIPALDHRERLPVSGPRVQFQVPVPSDTPLGGPLEASYHYESDVDMPPRTITTEAFVAAPTQLDLKAPSTAPRGSVVDVRGLVRDDLGEPVPTGTVELTLLGNATTAQVRNGQFQAQLAIGSGAPVGDARIGARYEASGPYRASTTAHTLAVQRPVSLTIDLPRAVEPGDLVEGRLRLTDDLGNPIPDQQVLLTTSGNATFLITTDAKGTATLVLRPSALEGVNVTASFPGSEDHAPARTQAQTTVATPAQSGPGPLLLLAGLATLALVAAALWVLHRTRGTLQTSAAEELDRGRRALAAGNEYRAVILYTYRSLVELVALRDVELDEQETLREYRTKLERGLGIDGPDVDTLFTLFEDVFYGPTEPGRQTRDRAIRTFHRVAQQLRGLPSPDPSDGRTNP